MKTFIIFSVCVVACFLQFTKANEECRKYQEEMYEKARDLDAKGELHECAKEHIPKFERNHEDFQKKMCEEMKNWKNKSKEEKERIGACMKHLYMQVKPKGDVPEHCPKFWKANSEKC